MSETAETVQVRPVDPSEQAEVLALLKPYVEQRKLLRRTIDELDTLLPNGFVAVADGRIVGFATLEIYSRKLAEVRLSRRHGPAGKRCRSPARRSLSPPRPREGYYGSHGDQFGRIVFSFVRVRLYTAR